MGKLIKVLLIGGAVVIVAVVVAVLFLLSNLNAMVKQAVEDVGTDTMGTEVKLSTAEIKIASASGALNGLTVANPEGFTSPQALRLGRIQLVLDTGSLGGDEVVLSEVNVDRAHLTFEQRGAGSNLQTLLDALAGSGDDDAATSGEAADVALVIKKFRLSGARVTVLHDRLEAPLELELPDIVLTDIGRVGQGETAASAARQILRPILDSTIQAAGRRAREELEGRVKDELEKQKEGALDSLRKKLTGD